MSANPDSLVTTAEPDTMVIASGDTIIVPAHGTRGRPAKPEPGLDLVPNPWEYVTSIKAIVTKFTQSLSQGVQELSRRGIKYLEKEAKKEKNEFWKETDDEQGDEAPEATNP